MTVPKKGGHAMQDHTGEHEGHQEARAEGNCTRELLLSFLREEPGRQSKQA